MVKDGYYLRNGKEIKKATASTPIMDKADLFKIAEVFKNKDGFTDKNGKHHKQPHKKYQILWELSIGLGYRIQDTLNLTVEDVTTPETEIIEKKTKKKKAVILNERLQALVNSYIGEFNLQPTDKLIFANRENGAKTKAIDKSQAYRMLKDVVNSVCPYVRFSNHTTRKAWAYQLYIHENKNIAVVQKALGHSTSLITADYIGLSRKELKEILINFDPYQ